MLKMKTNFLAIILLLFTFSVQLIGQNNTNEIGSCSCLSFVSACSGEPVTGISVKVSTRWCEEGTSSRTYAVDEGGRICGVQPTRGCIVSTVCVEGSDWEVCDVSGCTVSLKKTVSQYPYINGQLVGYGALSPGNSSAYKFCERIHTGDLNIPAGAEEIPLCPGEDVSLFIQDLSITESSGYCLTVNILNSSGSTTVASKTYDASEVSGSTVDVSALFSGLTPGTMYILEMIVSCCEGETKCTVNSRKFAYFTVIPPFSFEALAVDGLLPGPISTPFTPATSPDGTILNNSVIFPPNLELAGYTLSLSSLVNPTGLPFTVTFFDTQCDANANNDVQIGGAQTLPGQVGQSLPFTVVVPADGCDCYRVTLEYDDGCGNAITKSFYFRVGPDCTGFKGEDPDEGASERALQSGGMGSLDIQLRENPVREELIFDILNEEAEGNHNYILEIFDVSGKIIVSQQLEKSSNQLSFPFTVDAGMYFYTIRYGKKVSTGKIVKK